MFLIIVINILEMTKLEVLILNMSFSHSVLSVLSISTQLELVKRTFISDKTETIFKVVDVFQIIFFVTSRFF